MFDSIKNFTIFDLTGYIFPGGFLILYLLWFQGIDLTSDRINNAFLLVPFFICSYVLGQMLSAIGTWLFKGIFIREYLPAPLAKRWKEKISAFESVVEFFIRIQQKSFLLYNSFSGETLFHLFKDTMWETKIGKQILHAAKKHPSGDLIDSYSMCRSMLKLETSEYEEERFLQSLQVFFRSLSIIFILIGLTYLQRISGDFEKAIFIGIMLFCVDLCRFRSELYVNRVGERLYWKAIVLFEQEKSTQVKV